MSFFKFISSRTFFINLVIAMAVIIGMYFSLIYSLGSYTHHGEKIIVPDFKGLTLKDAHE